jgi:hypothetical protein
MGIEDEGNDYVVGCYATSLGFEYEVLLRRAIPADPYSTGWEWVQIKRVKEGKEGGVDAFIKRELVNFTGDFIACEYLFDRENIVWFSD